ncbi:MAG: RidA family protein [Bryobacteraceae bacterium]|jgi:enamine deaminase RidA (YjgF/YER057c/UK114 family)
MRRIWLLALVGALAVTLSSWGKKKKEEETQVLQLPKDPPSALTAETRRLVFHVTPLSAKGLLSQQTRDALKWLLHSTNGGAVVKLRAFVAGSGDLRRVRELVSETFTEHRLPLPVLSVVQVGALPMEAAQVVMESTSVARKDVNQYGLVYISGQGASSSEPLDPVLPLAQQSLARLATAVKAAGSDPDDVARVTCFLSSLDGYGEVRQLVESTYHGAALNFVQVQRAPARAVAECEAVARLRWNTGTPIHMLNPEGLAESPQLSQIALISAPRVILTGTQEAFGFQDADARLAFERLQKSLSQEGGSMREVAFTSLYPLSSRISEQLRKIRGEFYNGARPPAGTILPFQGLPSMDAGFAVDVVAVKQ